MVEATAIGSHGCENSGTMREADVVPGQHLIPVAPTAPAPVIEECGSPAHEGNSAGREPAGVTERGGGRGEGEEHQRHGGAGRGDDPVEPAREREVATGVGILPAGKSLPDGGDKAHQSGNRRFAGFFRPG
jgi:hypothetical protein